MAMAEGGDGEGALSEEELANLKEQEEKMKAMDEEMEMEKEKLMERGKLEISFLCLGKTYYVSLDFLQNSNSIFE